MKNAKKLVVAKNRRQKERKVYRFGK